VTYLEPVSVAGKIKSHRIEKPERTKKNTNIGADSYAKVRIIKKIYYNIRTGWEWDLSKIGHEKGTTRRADFKNIDPLDAVSGRVSKRRGLNAREKRRGGGSSSPTNKG